MLKDIIEKPIVMKSYFSEQASDLLKKLLTKDPAKRIGAVNDAAELKRHSFFEDIDWDMISKK